MMSSTTKSTHNKPHAVCIPYPAQGHITPMFKLALLLHSKGFHISFVNSEYNHSRLIKSRGPNSLHGLPTFHFHSIPDGLPPPPADQPDATQDIPSLCDSTSKSCLAPFLDLLHKLNRDTSNEVPPVSCIISDGAMSFTLQAGKDLGVPVVLFWTPSGCGFLCYTQYHLLVQKGLTPLKDTNSLTNGYLDTIIDWIPGIKGISLEYLPSFIRTTNPNDIMLNYIQKEIENASRGCAAIILNTFYSFENEVLDALHKMYPNLYTIGPINLFLDKMKEDNLKGTIGSNLWKEEVECIEWLDSKEPNSVVYVNFGSITVMTPNQLEEFALGLANSNKPFLWIIRPDLVVGQTAMLAPEFGSIVKDRGMLANWCPQEQVLKHPSIGGFLSHMGWNSTLESVSCGVPMVCWPFFAEQQTNCWFASNVWGIGMEIGGDVKRDEVEKHVRELMEGKKGIEMRRKAMEWKREAEEATKPGGSSYQNLEKVLGILLENKKIT